MPINETILRDALHNLSPSCGNDAQYDRGLLVGLVAGLQATGLTFAQAIAVASENAPMTVVYNSCPMSWLEAFKIAKAKPAGYKENNCRVWERAEGR